MTARALTPTAQQRRARVLLHEVFGLDRLRAGQKAVINRVLAGQPTLATMPTGAGKSLCYQLPALLLPGLTLVVSPLIALMQDQCQDLQAKGVRAVQLNSAIGGEATREAEAAIAQGEARIVMVTPERLAEPAFLALLDGRPVSLLVVDEAHCISQWGHDFRPAFLEIGPAVRALGKPTVLALTATANEDVARDIREQLAIPASGVVHTGTYRPNLDLRVDTVAREADKLERALALVRREPGAGLVYCATIKAAEQVHAALAAADESVGLYHGRLPAGERSAVQDAFMEGRCRVMVATNAFGLGIDKPDIRFVLHYQVPAGLEAYYQEAGRAGRDGEPSLCTLLFLRADRAVQQFFMAGRYPTGEDAQAIYAALAQPSPEGSLWTLPLLQSRLARPRAKVQVALGVLRRHRVVALQGHDVHLLQPGLEPDALDGLMRGYAGKRELDREGLERMVSYALAGQCRWKLLLDHLEGEAPFERCGHCDNCRRIAAHEKVMDTLAQAAPAGAAPASAEAAPGAGAAHAHAAFQRGDVVRVPRYGRGLVEAADALQVTVAFPDGSRRSFQPDFVAPWRGRGKAAALQARAAATAGGLSAPA
ncbi:MULTISPECIES: ATP-dependent DNA helicase RecQ [Ramlibacter]|uniref:ATP-dependent DNA helicase RecQ n=1 Tax=Ramlibacter aquaticus TaxID=2780094 RepID=A0ABR9SDZ3_9BURK|nr:MULTISPECIES: ATP-dependent DNA helicase RecQ [Ramlibacter]MBE7940569.1 ATP-dependent DNA helicase RecQ [Ramlibacter aquaticus]